MTYRIDRGTAAEGLLLELRGQVDATALDEIRAATAAARAPVSVVLKEGCQIEPGVLEELSRAVDLRAESPSLARWLQQLRNRETTSRG